MAYVANLRRSGIAVHGPAAGFDPELLIVAPGWTGASDSALPAAVPWADLREDKIINPAPGVWPIFGPLGHTAGPGSSGYGPGSKNSAGCTKNQPRLSPIRGQLVVLRPTAIG